MKRASFIFLLVLGMASVGLAQIESLRSKMQTVIGHKKADVGMALWHMERGDTLSMNGHKRYPMLSVFKFPIALVVMHRVDKGELALNQKIFVPKADLYTKTWSPLREKYPEGNITLTLKELLEWTVCHSDNNTCDILLRLIDGPKTVETYAHALGMNDFAMSANERNMHTDTLSLYANTMSPWVSARMLKDFYDGKLLSPKSRRTLYKMMLETSTGPKRLKGQLPPHTPVAHRTGTSFTDRTGLTAAVNDIGIITLPHGEHVILCVYVGDSLESGDTNEKIIADLAKLVWDYYTIK